MHMYLSVPLKYSPDRVLKILKGKRRSICGGTFLNLARSIGASHTGQGYFVSSVGIDSAIVQKYVMEQEEAQMREERLRFWRNDSR